MHSFSTMEDTKSLVLEDSSLLAQKLSGAMPGDNDTSMDIIGKDQRFPVAELSRVKKPVAENKDASETEENDYSEDDDDDDDDLPDEDVTSSEEGSDDEEDDSEDDDDVSGDGNGEDGSDSDDDDDTDDSDDSDDNEDED
ncbi:hypothetical protein PanWU01x14_332040 [Parasponia andersonii]|uniref:Uncharacterized protein n=1 Tax=Parasponia andersonii TaxID=3476 RepID=A0A2P5AHD9_PARAD|nr:hypothetical protein PanWU01x14_332040 [Parasponia andersonii]